MTQAEPKHQLEPPRYNKTNYNHRWRPATKTDIISSILFYSFPHNNIPTMTLKHKVSRKIYQRKFSRYMHTVVSMKQIPSIYSKPELKGRDYPLFILVPTKSAFPVFRKRISMIVTNHLVLPIIFLKMSTGGRDENFLFHYINLKFFFSLKSFSDYSIVISNIL